MLQNVERQQSSEQRGKGYAVSANGSSDRQRSSYSYSYAYDPVLDASKYNASLRNRPATVFNPAAAHDAV